ncbi:hypothetical protein [Massilia glaciei]|uniref:hypothetical protein n=1 Tax=Massilia glaciei TaxID=1524097 RepID=UPI0011B1C71D|nr:hypothetical protein [Massilia glaciei]
MFGPDAFYELDTSGSQAEKQFGFRPGEFCVVASQPSPGQVRFDWYKFTSFRLDVDDERKSVRVLLGKFEKEETIPKVEAASHKYYYPFFDKNGNFKQQSVL